jgi:hypothetical protein
MFYSVQAQNRRWDQVMGIEIRGRKNGVICVSGDIENVLMATCVKRGQPFVLGFSDGTLIEGIHDPETARYRFRPLVEGAGILIVEDDRTELLWSIEWATIAPLSGMMMADRPPDFACETTRIDDDLHVGSVSEWLRPSAAHKHERQLACMA